MPSRLKRQEASTQGSAGHVDGHATKKARAAEPAETSTTASLERIGITTSEQLVKTLKGADDVSRDGAVLDKVGIALIAWRDTRIPIPRKAHLLSTWILTCFFRDARTEQSGATASSKAKKLDSNSVFDYRYWSLLRQTVGELAPDELRSVVGRQSVLPLLASLGRYLEQSTSLDGEDESMLDDVAACIQKLDVDPSFNPTASLEQLTAALQSLLVVVGQHADADNASDLAVLLRALIQRWSTANQTKKIRSAFLSELLPAFCNAYDRVVDSKLVILQSCLCRLSYASLYQEQPESGADEEIRKSVCDLANGKNVMATFLEQKWLQLVGQDHIAAREAVWITYINPFLHSLIKNGSSDAARLGNFLSVVQRKNLYPFGLDRTDYELPSTTMSKLVTSLVARLGQDTESVLDCLLLAYQIDEGVFDSQVWKQIIATVAQSHSKLGQVSLLLKTSCSSHSRARTLDIMIDEFFAGLQLAEKGVQPDGEQEIGFPWQDEFEVALREFVSGDQTLLILDMVRASSSKATFPQTVLDLASHVVASIGIAEPVKKEACDRLELLLVDVCESVITKGAGDQRRKAASMRLMNAITSRCSLNDSLWAPLLRKIDAILELFFAQRKFDIRVELQIEALKAGAERIRRDILSEQESTKVLSWLQGAIESIDPVHHKSIKGTTNGAPLGANRFVVLDLIVSAYLPLLERIASVPLLELLAGRLVDVLQQRASQDLPYLVAHDSADLELPRWRESFFSAVRSRIEKADAQQAIAWLSIVAEFPTRFVPRDCLQTLIEKAGGAQEDDISLGLKSWAIEVARDLKVETSHKSGWLTPKLQLSDDNEEANVLSRMRHIAEAEGDEGHNRYITLCQVFIDVLARQGDAVYLYAQPFSRHIMRSEAEAYEECLNSLLTEIGNTSTIDLKLGGIVQTLTILLCNGPEGTLKTSQTALRALLGHFVDLHREQTPASVLFIVQSIEASVTGKALLFRSGEAGMVLAILTRLLAPNSSAVPNEAGETSTVGRQIFQSITTTLIALVRLRPESVAPVLPQLSIVFCQLVALFRQCSRSSSQTQSHSDLVPRWLDIRHDGLGSTEARQLTRLLSAVTTRTRSSTASKHRRRSQTNGAKRRDDGDLGRAFGAHALPVLLAYVYALSLIDRSALQTTFVMGEARQEIERAMFCVCDTLGSWQRDVLMDLITDEGQRILFRQFWRAYDSQRYRGGD